MNTTVSFRRTRWAAALMLLVTFGSAGWSSSVFAQQLPGARAPVRDSARIFRSYPKSWTEIKTQNIVMQKQDFSCGAAALATMMTYHLGQSTSEYRLLRELDVMLTRDEILDRMQNGLTLTDLRRLANRLKFPASIGKLTLQQLTQARTPIIVGIIVEEYDHFVVYRGTDGRYIYLADPARGNLRVPINEFVAQWQQNLGLVVVPQDEKPVSWSPLMLQADETMLGETNRLYVRDRMTTGPGAAGN